MREEMWWLFGVLAVAVLFLGSFYGSYWFNVGDPPTHSMDVFRSQGDPVGSLNVNETYENAPALAAALDEAIASNQTSVVVTTDQETIDRIRDYLVGEFGNYVDPFLWRGAVFQVGVTT